MDSSRLLPAVQKLVKLFNADSAPQRGRIGLFNFILQIFIMIIQSLVNVLIHKPRRRIKRAQGQSGLDAAILDELCAKSFALLHRSGLDSLMLKDFSFSRHLTKKDVKSPNLRQKLTSMTREITDWLGLPPLKEVTVTLLPKDSNYAKHFGTYESAYRRINFYLKEDTFPEQIEAAICHECTHYFMELRLLDDWSDRQKNEYMTDVISCLVGFSKIMIRGYMVMTHARYRVIMWDTNSMRVGYLDAVDCEHVREVLLKQRPELQKRLKERTDREALRLEVERNIAGAKAMLEQIEAMYESHSIPKPGHMSKANLSVLQNALLSLETGELRTRLNQCESQRDVAAASKEIASLCKELTVLHAAFR